MTTLFFTATALFASLCISFNKVIDVFIYYICKYVRDITVYPFGPYLKSKPIHITYASIDNVSYTNKMQLMMNWKWNFDFGGITCDDIKLMYSDPKKIIIRYTLNDIEHNCSIHIAEDIYIIDTKTSNILFGEICLNNYNV